MLSFQRDFIELAIARQALSFGRFTLKSGRISPYFFNAGLFYSGEALAKLGHYYAEALINSQLQFDMLFGPAYKGIPLVAGTVVALAERNGRDVPYAFNRKEAKDHGEGGTIVGAPVRGKVVIVDDVITAGTAIREVIRLIVDLGAEPVGVLVGLNRQERGQSAQSAIQELEAEFSIPVISIAALENIISYLEDRVQRQNATDGPINDELLNKVREYRRQYGI